MRPWRCMLVSFTSRVRTRSIVRNAFFRASGGSLGASTPATPSPSPRMLRSGTSGSHYHQYLLYNMDQREVDVLVLPSASPYALRDSALITQSVKAWDDGINALAPAWLGSGLNIHQYRVGLDTIPTKALWDPEIV